jgi:transglutaminase-like putative cysteine protease
MQPQPIRQLILALSVAMAPLAFELPVWAILWCTILWGYLLSRDPTRSPMHSRVVRILFFSIGCSLVFLSAGLRFEGGDFVALLAVMAGVKPLEVCGRRDSIVTVFLAYFLIITSLFVFENLAMTLYLFISVWIITAVLIHVNHPTGFLGPQMKLSGRMVLLSVPLMMLLFLIFPRLSGHYLGVPWSRQSHSGFSSIIRMGDVSQLVVTDTPVFSVSFDTSPPESNQLYWRGIVFQSFDGDTWQPVQHQLIRQEPIQGEKIVHYNIILEPHGHRNLFVLDLPVKAAPVATIMNDHTLMARHHIHQRLSYDAASFLDCRQTGIAHPGPSYLQLPPGRNPQTLALGRQLALTHGYPTVVVRAGLDFFKNNMFSYTLRPDRLGRDTVDDFLFISRNGFCEHFASAFTVLMRSAGVPARIVGGYQGGRWNAWGNFLTVRQADAHVWCEVWLKGQGWVRVDPTFAVAPVRIDEGIDGLFENLSWLSGRTRYHLLNRWIESTQLTWEAVNIRWNMWFMGFSAEDQTTLLKNVWHQGRWLLLAIVLVGLTIAVFFTYQWHVKRQPATIEEKSLIVYNRFLKKMSRLGLIKSSYQGPYDYYQKVVRHHPELKKEVGEIIGRYIALRYSRKQSKDNLKALRGQVRRFHPRKIVDHGE